MAGELQKGGFASQLAGIGLMVLSFIPGLQFLFPLGQGLLFAGQVAGIAGSFLTPYEPLSTGDDERRSPAYGYDQFENPVERDAVVPVIYSEEGVPVAPPYAVAFSTPAGQLLDEDFATAKSRKGQALSALFPVAPHRVGAFSDLRIDDMPVFTEVVGREIGTGNGTKREFVLGSRVVKETVRVQVGGTDIRVTSTRVTTFALRAGLYLYTIDLKDSSDDVLADEEPVVLEWAAVDGASAAWRRVDQESADPTGTFLRPIVWPESKKRLRIHTQGWEPASTTSVLRVTYRVREWSSTYPGVQFGKNAAGDMTVSFSSTAKPAAGAKVTADFWRRNIPGVRVDFRYGTENDLPLDGFDALRQTYGNGGALDEDAPLEVDTQQEVDDVLVDVGSAADFRRYSDDGSTSSVTARIRIHYKRQQADGTWPSSWTALPHPRGASNESGNVHDATSFNLTDDSPSRVFWTFSLRGVLQKFADKQGDATLIKAFTRSRYRVKVTRVNKVSNDTEETWRDAIVFVSHTEVRDVLLAWPGFAKAAIHGLNAKRTGGRLPRVRVTATGQPDIPKLVDNGGTLEWDDGDPANQSNPVWAACDFFVAHYGGGRVFDRERNIDKESAFAAAARADREVDLPNGDSEVASRLDLTIDTRSNVLDHVARMVEAAGIVPFLQGDVLKFAIDAPVDLDAVPRLYDGTDATGATYDDSQGAEWASLSSVVSEIEVVFYEREADFARETAWAAPEEPATERRVKRVELRGVARRTEAQRHADDLWLKATHEGRDLGVRGSVAILAMECGDVFRFTSERLQIDHFFRVVQASVGTGFYVDLSAREYVPEAYGQQSPRRRELRNVAQTRRTVQRPNASQVPNVPASARIVPKRNQ